MTRWTLTVRAQSLLVFEYLSCDSYCDCVALAVGGCYMIYQMDDWSKWLSTGYVCLQIPARLCAS